MSAFFSLYLYSSKENSEFVISKLLLRIRLDISKYIKSIIRINFTTTLQLWQWTPPLSLDRKMLPQFKWKINIRYLKKETFVELQVNILRFIKSMGSSKEILKFFLFCMYLGYFTLLHKAKWVQLNGKTLQVLKNSVHI